MNFITFLEQRVRRANSLLCVGLDPRTQTVDALRDECFRLIDATAEFAAAFKPNSAFFEAHGPEGMAALREVIGHIPPDIPVILDAKRGDIADTAQAYATAIFDGLGAHALTANPYLGGDTLQPFLARPERGVFVLCKTSNPGADEFQALPVVQDDRLMPLYEIVACQAQHWNVHGNVALVVGATDVRALARVRAQATELWFLVPGIGAQGGDLVTALAAGLRTDGLGLLINVSRQLARAADPRREAMILRDVINQARLEPGDKETGRPRAHPGDRETGERQTNPQSAIYNPQSTIAALAHDLLASNCVRFGAFKLKSGVISPIYIDLRRLVTYPEILRRVAKAYAVKLAELTFDRLAGIPYAALPIATAIALETGHPLVYPRREAKEYGTRSTVEGDYSADETIVVIDDVTTTGGSKIEAIQKLEEVGLVVRDVVVLIDRMQGAGARLAESGYQLHTIVTLPALLDEWLRSGAISQTQFDEVNAFLNSG